MFGLSLFYCFGGWVIAYCGAYCLLQDMDPSSLRLLAQLQLEDLPGVLDAIGNPDIKNIKRY